MSLLNLEYHIMFWILNKQMLLENQMMKFDLKIANSYLRIVDYLDLDVKYFLRIIIEDTFKAKLGICSLIKYSP